MNNVDNQFHRNMSECNQLGIPCGVYWFSYALNEAEAVREADFCLAAVKPYRVDYPIFYDFEYDSTRYAKSKGVEVTRDFVTRLARSFCNRVKSAGYIAGVYTNQDYSRHMIDLSRLKEFELWYAWYSDKINRDDAAIWQFSSQWRVDGIAGNVDLDYCFKTFPPVKEEPDPAAETGSKPETEPETGTNPVPDNTPDPYGRVAVEKAVGRGILRGNDAGDLMLHSPVSRQDLCVILDRLGLL